MVVEMERIFMTTSTLRAGEGTETPRRNRRLAAARGLGRRGSTRGSVVVAFRSARIRDAPVRRTRCDDALGNLIGNACRHSNHVWLTGVAVTDGIDILVDDDGPGIRPSDRDRAFEPLSAWIPHGTRRPEASDWASLSPRRGAQSRRRDHSRELTSGWPRASRPPSALTLPRRGRNDVYVSSSASRIHGSRSSPRWRVCAGRQPPRWPALVATAQSLGRAYALFQHLLRVFGVLAIRSSARPAV